MNTLDVFIDMGLLKEQYDFLITKYEVDEDKDSDLWEGILNLFESMLFDYETP